MAKHNTRAAAKSSTTGRWVDNTKRPRREVPTTDPEYQHALILQLQERVSQLESQITILMANQDRFKAGFNHQERELKRQKEAIHKFAAAPAPEPPSAEDASSQTEQFDPDEEEEEYVDYFGSQ